MKKIKVRIYPKDSNGQGSYVNKTAKFLQKAAYGTEVKNVLVEIDDFILEELLSNQDPDSIAFKIQSKYGLDYYRALDRIEDMKGVYESSSDKAKEDEKVEFIPDANPYLENDNETNFGNRSNYPVMSDQSMALDEEAFPWDSEEGANPDFEAAGNELLGNQMPMVDSYTVTDKKQGGAMTKHKFVKKVVSGLKKAAEGTEQQDTEANEATTNDIPIGGRGQLIFNFMRGMKDAGNKYYANQIYDQSKQLEQQQFGAAEGMQIEQPEIDVENPAHHLLAFSQAMGDTFSQPMNENQRIGSSDPEIPEAKYGRRMARQAARQWDRMFGNIPIGMFGQGVPNYLGYIMPGQGMGMPQMDPRQMYLSGMDVRYTKRPFRKTMEINNIPFFMPPAAMAAKQIPYTYPGEIITRDVVTEETKAFGGPIMDPQPNQYGQLQRFVGGGDEMPTPAYSAYVENDANTKDVEDPFYKDGGLHKFQGLDKSQQKSGMDVDPGFAINPATGQPWTRDEWQAAEQKRADADAERKRMDDWVRSQMSGNKPQVGMSPDDWRLSQGQSMGINPAANNVVWNGTQWVPNGMQYGMPYGMPSYNVWGRGNQAGSYDPWASGTYNPLGDIGKVLGGLGRKNKSYWLSQSGPILKDGQPWQPTQQTTQQGFAEPQGDYTTGISDASEKMYVTDAQSEAYHKARELNPNLTVKDFLGQGSNNGFPQMQTDPTQAGYRPNVKYDERGLFGRKKSGSLTWDWYDPANPQQNQGNTGTNQNVNLGTDPKKSNDFTVKGMSVNTIKDGAYKGTKNGMLVSSEIKPNRFQDWRIKRQATKAYGGVPHFQGLDESQVQFDPNDNTQAVDPNYHPSFTTNFDIHPTRDNFQGLNAGKNLGAHGIIEFSNAWNNDYQNSYLAANSNSNNKAPANQLAHRGSYSGQNQKRPADPETNPYFNQPVGAKTGGTMKYKKDEVYDLTQAEIGAILAAGGQIKFI